MKKKILSLLCLAIILISSFSFISAAASKPLDEILYYEITVDPRADGTLDMNYKIKWKVLDSSSEGPLEWIKVGAPNSHVDNIVGLTNNIDEIRYYEESGKKYIRIDLDRKYSAGEILDIEYSFHQTHMYVVEEEQHLLRYSFTPGWLTDIEVKELKILWNASNVMEASTSEITPNGYYVWNSSLGINEKFNITVKYNSDVFEYNLEEQYDENEGSGDGVFIIILVIILFVLIILFILWLLDGSSYDGGYGGRSSHIFVHSSCASSCACVSSCACACACAGGGRAGCTKKDFYHTKLSTEDINKAIEKLK